MDELRLDHEFQRIYEALPFLWEKDNFHAKYFTHDYGMYYRGFVIGLEKVFETVDPKLIDSYFWAVNEQALQVAIEKGWKIDYTFDGLSKKEIRNEIRAMDSIASDNKEKVIEIFDGFPFRMKEVEFLLNQKYIYEIDVLANIVHWIKIQ